jgi:hypothetical protein
MLIKQAVITVAWRTKNGVQLVIHPLFELLLIQHVRWLC